MPTATRSRSLIVGATVTAGMLVTGACGGANAPSRTRAASRRAATVGSVPPPSCAPVSWPTNRKVAELVAVPAEEGDLGQVAPAVQAGAGATVLFGAQAPANLADQLVSLRALGPAGVAPLVMVDEEGGDIQRLRNLVGAQASPRQLAQTTSPEAVELSAAALGQSLHALGIQVDLAPVLDLDAGPGPSDSYPVGSRSFSRDPGIASTYGVAFANGLQAGGVTPVAKAFPGEGTQTTNGDYGVAVTEPFSVLEQRGDVQPFAAAIAAGVPAVMVANEIVPGLTSVPATLSRQVITGMLRTVLGFHGLVLTDSLSAATVSQAGYSVADASLAAINAGADLVLFTATNPNAAFLTVVARLAAAVASGQLAAPRLEDALTHVMHAKGLAGC